MHEITEVDPHDETAFRDWFTALHEGATAGRTAPLVATYDATAYSLRDPGPALRRVPVAAVLGDRTVGAMLFELPLLEDLETVLVEIDVLPPHRGQGVGAALWGWATRRAADEGRSIFQTEVNVPAGESTDTWPGALFARRLGFVSENVEDRLVVALPYDEQRLAAIGETQTASEGYRLLTWVGPCPEEHLQTYADLQTEMSRDVPQGGMTRDEVRMDVDRVRTNEKRLAENYLSLVTLATTADGEPAGYTQILVQQADPENVIQEDTLVLRAHRGHNLGTRLKASNLHLLRQHHEAEGWLHTWTAETNTAMQRVNERFGFRSVEKLHEFEKSAR